MKALMILGAIVGFLIGTGFGLAGNTPWPATLWRACAAAFIAAVLTRWWGRVWLKSLSDARHKRRTVRAPLLANTKPGTKL
jgi:hypothetical protein